MAETLWTRIAAAYQGARSGFRLGWREPSVARSMPDGTGEPMTLSPTLPDDPRQKYSVLRLYRDNRVYRELSNALRALKVPQSFGAIRGLENPANQAVSYHVIHICPGSLEEALPLALPPEDALRQAAERIFRWSWLDNQKDVLVETAATLGDAFIRSWSSETQAAIEARDPDDITEFSEDSQGNIVYIRLDVETADEDGQTIYYTEAWSKEDNAFAQWWHKIGLGADYVQLGEPSVENQITDFGYDFVPYVRFPFKGGTRRSTRSQGVFEIFLEAIDQNNRDMTVIRDRYFRHGKPLWQSVTGLPKPAEYDLALQEDAQGSGTGDTHPENPDQGSYPDGEDFVRNPKDTRLESLVPSIDYGAGISLIEDGRRALERDISELRFFREDEGGDRSGAALDRLQAPAMHRAASARGNFQAAILKSVKMCLSMAQVRGLQGFESGVIGTYEGGQFDELRFEARPIRPETALERAQREQAEAEAHATWKDASPELWRLHLIEQGYDEATAKQIVDAGSSGDSRTPEQQAIERINRQARGEE